MKKIFFSLSFALVCTNMLGQIESRVVAVGTAVKEALQLKEAPNIQSSSHQLPSLSELKLESELNSEKKDAPGCIGKRLNASYDLSDGIWTQVDGGRIWSIVLSSQESTFLNLILSDLNLPEGSSLCITNQEGNYLIGPITSKNIKSRDFLMTDFVPGQNVRLCAFEPTSQYGKLSLSVKDVVSGIVEAGEDMQAKGVASASDCRIDVACYDDFKYRTQAGAICRITLTYSDGSYGGTGCLIRTADNSLAPYILTAFHCIDHNGSGKIENFEIQALDSCLITFNNLKNTCGGSISNGVVFHGATYIAGYAGTDFALLELDLNSIELDFVKANMYWLGWDRGSSTPQSGACLHHPAAVEMKISVDDDPLQSFSTLGAPNGFWKTTWDEGTVEGNSSGSPILDQQNRVRGQLAGNIGENGSNPCSNLSAAYGKFSISWEGEGTATSRLKDWLDPTNTNQTETDGRKYYVLMGQSVICDSAVYSVDNLEAGMSVSWSISDSYYSDNSNLFRPNYPTNGKCTIFWNSNHPLNATLIATVLRFNGSSWDHITRIDKNVQTENFYCTISSSGSPVSFSLPTNLVSGMMLTVPYGGIVTLQSPDFKHMTVSATGNYTYYENDLSHGLIHFTVLNGNSITITGHSTNSCQQFAISFIGSTKAKVWPPIDFFELLSLGDGNISAKLLISGDTDMLNSLERNNMAEFTGDWTLDVYNVTTNEKMLSQKVNGLICNVNAVSWQAGVYSFTATLSSGETFSKKIRLQ